jgi:8-oxo-dGTP pyrophosphatase MutT (NUDIX family)
MILIYAQEAIPNEIRKSIFLAGPSLRPGQDGVSWRKKAIKILDLIGYDGVVFIPEARVGNFEDFNYEKQIIWETRALRASDNILFHINRNIKDELLGLTTNDEWGFWKNSGKCVLSTELNADKVRYQEWWAKELKIPAFHELFSALKHIEDIQEDYVRIDGERFIPQEIWKTPQFQSWYKQLKLNQNWISDAKVLNSYRIPSNNKIFAFSLWMNIYIREESRYKNNEFVFSRPDISSCVLYLPNEDVMKTEIVLVSEFRTPVNNMKGLVFELPGGSSMKDGVDPKQIMIEELEEETGFIPQIDKLNFESARQICATMLTHKSYLYSYQLSNIEMIKIKSCLGQTFGNIEDTERTELHIVTLEDIITMQHLDWSNVGQIMSVVR